MGTTSFLFFFSLAWEIIRTIQPSDLFNGLKIPLLDYENYNAIYTSNSLLYVNLNCGLQTLPQNIHMSAYTHAPCHYHLQQPRISARIPFLKSFYSLAVSAMSFGNDWFPLGISAHGDVLFFNTSFFSKFTNLLSVNTGFEYEQQHCCIMVQSRGGGVDVGGSRGEDSPDVSSSTHLDTDRLAPLGEMQMRLTV